MSRRLIALLILAASVFTACGRSASTPPAANGYRLVLEEGLNGGHISIRDAGSGALVRQLPLGTPSPDWSRYYVLTQMAGASRLDAIEPASGRMLAQLTIPAGYTLPRLNEGPSSGLSPNGEWIALENQAHDANGLPSTSFLVGRTTLAEPLKTVRLSGDFTFDALSNDGKRLYLIQRLDDQGRYRVRLYDVPSQWLTEQPVVDKREPNEPMNGIRADSVNDPRGSYVFTVYAREHGPFIHALLLDQPFAWCLDLPASPKADMEEQFHWSLAITRDGSRLYAINTVSGRISEMNPDKLPEAGRTGRLALVPRSTGLGWLVTDAEAKGEAIGGAWLSADERTLFALGDKGVVAIDTATLKTRAHYLDGHAIRSIRLSTDGNWLYAAEPEANTVWQINPRTGAVAGAVKGMTNPWAILWAGR